MPNSEQNMPRDPFRTETGITETELITIKDVLSKSTCALSFNWKPCPSLSVE